VVKVKSLPERMYESDDGWTYVVGGSEGSSEDENKH
jgi:hypothetical protein